MDYPPPRVRLDAQGKIDLSQAYAVGPGAYDVWAIHWGYGVFPPAERSRFAPRDRRRRSQEGLPLSVRRRRAPRVRLRSAREPVGRRVDAVAVSERPNRRAPRGDQELRRAQHSPGRADHAAPGALRSAVLLPSLRAQRHVEGDRRHGVRERRARRRAAGDATGVVPAADGRAQAHARRAAAGGAGDSRHGADADGARRDQRDAVGGAVSEQNAAGVRRARAPRARSRR